MAQRRRHHRTVLEIPSDHGETVPRSRTTQLGHSSLEPADEPLCPPRSSVAAPWTEELYISPSGRIFLPVGFDLDRGRPRTKTRPTTGSERAPSSPGTRSAHPTRERVVPRPRVVTRESWVLPEDLLTP